MIKTIKKNTICNEKCFCQRIDIETMTIQQQNNANIWTVW